MLVVLSFGSTLLWADTGPLDSETAARLASQPTWHKLLVYEADGDGWKSAIHSPEFFLSPAGDHDALAELNATVMAMYQPANADADQHAQCRFRGRFVWLRQQGLLTDVAEQPCPAFQAFSSGDSVQSVSLVLATGYLGNPASFYGHTLLKLNSPVRDNRTILLDQTVNYGAIIPDDEDPISYVIKGVAGLYDAGFTHIQYYYHDHSYGETQLRDQWEYELELTRPEVELVVAHAWEVLGRKYDYYFFTRNCAYRMAEVVEVVDGVHIIPDRTFMIPQTYLQQSQQQQRNGKPLIRGRYYHPSRQSRLYQRFAALSDAGEDAVAAAVAAGNALDFRTLAGYQALDDSEHHKVVDALLDYYQFRELDELDDAQQQVRAKSPAYTATLRERYVLPPAPSQPIVAPDHAPEQGRMPGLVRSGWARDAEGKGALSLLVRPAYYDALDADVGHVRDGKLVMGELGVYAYQNRLKLDHFDALVIEGVNSSTTGLPGDRGNAWRVQFGWQRLDRSCDQCVVPRLSAQFGLARPFAGRQLMLGGFAGGGAQDSRQGYGYSFVEGTLFANWHREQFDWRLEVNDYYQINSALDHEFETRLQGRYRVGLNQELRWQLLNQRGSTMEVGYGVYW